MELESGHFLTYQNAWPAGWSVVEIGDRGDVRRRAGVERRPDQRPLLAQPGQREVTLLWPREDGAHTVDWERLP